MNGFEKFLHRQRVLAASYHDFLQTLDPTRTITLLDMLMGKAAAFSLTKVWFPWLDRMRIREAVENACEFLESIQEHPRVRRWGNSAFAFIQASDSEEDAREHLRRMRDRRYLAYRLHYGNCPPETRYGPTEGNCSGELVGPPTARRIAPMSTFNSIAPIFSRPWMETRDDMPLICGYRVPPQHPEALEMSALTSTSWIAQVLTHDIGHFFLPQVGPKFEGVHNIVMIHAMNLLGERNWSIPEIRTYDELMYYASCDPFFFLYAAEAIKACKKIDGIKPVSLYFLKELERYYSRPTRFARWQRIWGITPEMDFETRCEQVVTKIEEFKHLGFGFYDS